MPPVQNSFAADYQNAETVTDINNPKVPRYQYREYPKMIYPKVGKPFAVASREEEQKALASGHSLTPIAKEEEPTEVAALEQETAEVDSATEEAPEEQVEGEKKPRGKKK